MTSIDKLAFIMLFIIIGVLVGLYFLFILWIKDYYNENDKKEQEENDLTEY